MLLCECHVLREWHTIIIILNYYFYYVTKFAPLDNIKESPGT